MGRLGPHAILLERETLNLRPAWAQVGPHMGWAPSINAVLMGCPLWLQGTLNFHLLAKKQPINVCKFNLVMMTARINE